MNSVSFPYKHSDNSSENTTGSIPDWGLSAEELYTRYHKLAELQNRAKLHPVDESSLLKVNHLLQLLMETLVELIEDISDKPATGASEREVLLQLRRHTAVIQSVVQQVDAGVAQLLEQYPALGQPKS